MSLRTDSNEDVEDVPPPAIPEDADDIPEHDRRLGRRALAITSGDD